MNLRKLIEIHKMSIAFVVLTMMAIYDQWGNPTAWLYLGLHGSYGFLWGLKGKYFPDKQWDKSVSLQFRLISTIALCLYWIAPFLITSRGVNVPFWLMTVSIFVFIFGVFLHFTADMQKYISLKLRPGELVTEGLWSKTRNPNYLGELLIYTSLATLSLHWLSYFIVFIWIIFFWLPNMYKKDRSLSRYTDFFQYKERSNLFIPYLF